VLRINAIGNLLTPLIRLTYERARASTHRTTLDDVSDSDDQTDADNDAHSIIREIQVQHLATEKAQVDTVNSVDGWNLLRSCVGAMAAELHLSRYSLPAPQTV
jgi:hypothetical protein